LWLLPLLLLLRMKKKKNGRWREKHFADSNLSWGEEFWRLRDLERASICRLRESGEAKH
jgi:hypothetical protein